MAAQANEGPVTTPGKLFLGGISWETSEEGLRAHFGKFGSIIDCVLMSDPQTNRPRGFGFVTFEDPISALEASREQYQMIDGRRVEVKNAVPKEAMSTKVRTKKVFVGGIPWSVTDEIMHEYFSQFGIVAEAQIIRDHASGKSRGFGYVTFEDEEIVDHVVDLSHTLGEKHVDVKKAVPKGTAPSRQRRPSGSRPSPSPQLDMGKLDSRYPNGGLLQATAATLGPHTALSPLAIHPQITMIPQPIALPQHMSTPQSLPGHIAAAQSALPIAGYSIVQSQPYMAPPRATVQHLAHMDFMSQDASKSHQTIFDYGIISTSYFSPAQAQASDQQQSLHFDLYDMYDQHSRPVLHTSRQVPVSQPMSHEHGGRFNGNNGHHMSQHDSREREQVRYEQQRMELQRLEQQRLYEQQRFDQQRQEQQQRLEIQQQQQQQRAEQQRLEQQRLEQQRLDQLRIEQVQSRMAQSNMYDPFRHNGGVVDPRIQSEDASASMFSKMSSLTVDERREVGLSTGGIMPGSAAAVVGSPHGGRRMVDNTSVMRVRREVEESPLGLRRALSSQVGGTGGAGAARGNPSPVGSPIGTRRNIPLTAYGLEGASPLGVRRTTEPTRKSPLGRVQNDLASLNGNAILRRYTPQNVDNIA